MLLDRKCLAGVEQPRIGDGEQRELRLAVSLLDRESYSRMARGPSFDRLPATRLSRELDMTPVWFQSRKTWYDSGVQLLRAAGPARARAAQLAIRATRAQRERVQAEFDAQMRAFEPPNSVAHATARAAENVGRSLDARERGGPGCRESNRGRRRTSTRERDRAGRAQAEPVSEDAPASARSSVGLLAVVASIVLVASFVLVWMFNRAPSATTPPVAQEPAQPIPIGPAVAGSAEARGAARRPASASDHSTRCGVYGCGCRSTDGLR